MSDATSNSNHHSSEGLEFFPPATPSSPWVTVLFVLVIVASLSPLFLYVYYGAVQHNLTLAVSPDGLSVDFGVGRIHIPADEIADVTYVEEPSRMRRTRGAGLSGFQMGWYRLDGYGPVYRLTTAGRHVVFVDTVPDAEEARPDTRYVFNPEDAETFVALLQAVRAGEAADVGVGDEGIVFRAVPSTTVFGDPLLIVSMLVSLPVAFGLPFLVRRGRTGMRYRVGPEGIFVRHLGTRRYRWESVRSVRRMDEPLPRMWRVLGAALSGYYAGDFSAGKLGSLKVYATRLEPPVVLMETRVGRVLISPEDVDGFMAAVERYRPEGE